MASTQSGLLQMLGPTQNMSIYRKRNGEYGLRRKGGPTAKRFAKDPNYAQARINTSEFGQAAKGSGLIRRAFRAMIPNVANDELHSRLTKVCKEVINSDAGHPRGSRMLMNGDLSLLRDFNFNPGGRLGLLVRLPFHHTTDRAAGTVRMGMPAFTPADVIRFPKHATHARLKMGAAVLQFEKEAYSFASASSIPIPKGRKPVILEDLIVQVPAGTGDPLFIAMAVEFLTWENGKFIPVLNSQFHLMQLTGIDIVATQQCIPQEALPVVETVTNHPIHQSASPIPDTPTAGQHSGRQQDRQQPEQPLVKDTQHSKTIAQQSLPPQASLHVVETVTNAPAERQIPAAQQHRQQSEHQQPKKQRGAGKTRPSLFTACMRNNTSKTGYAGQRGSHAPLPGARNNAPAHPSNGTPSRPRNRQEAARDDTPG